MSQQNHCAERRMREVGTYRHSYLLLKLPISSEDADEAVDIHIPCQRYT